ncbi:transposase [Bacillus sp. S10(2024)]|uniref:transposase n=1 Tax=Bacillus sp. S10(2024) TaxID=3162886 RepID=UPI003D1C420B
MGKKKKYYPESVKRQVIELKVEGKLTNRKIMEKFGIRDVSQIKTWMKWFRNEEEHRFAQPIGKHYSYWKDPADLTEIEELKCTNAYLEMKVELLKSIRKSKGDGPRSHHYAHRRNERSVFHWPHL